MFLWYLNAIRTLSVVALHMLSAGQLVDCDRVWDMAPKSHLPAGKTYEEWYGSFELDCNDLSDPYHLHFYCYGSNC